MKVPCKNCDKRNMECHSVCESYIEFDKHQNEIREARHRLHEENENVKESTKRAKRRSKVR